MRMLFVALFLWPMVHNGHERESTAYEKQIQLLYVQLRTVVAPLLCGV